MKTQTTLLNSICFSIFAFAFFMTTTSFQRARHDYALAGIWESEEKDLQIEMYMRDGGFAGRMIYFKCTTDDIMRTRRDIEYPDRLLNNRYLLGLTLVTSLTYQGGNLWDDGKIYDPNSGRTFEASCELTDPERAVVRGYWKYRWLGRSMVFHRKH